MTSLLFSIIIPTYNSANTIGACVESILCQTNKLFEIICVDGGSEDKTINIIENYQTQTDNIKYISEKDNGIYDAMNKGVAMARGEWLYFLGSDDTLYNDGVLNSVWQIAQDRKEKIIYGNVFVKGDAGWAKDGAIYDGYFSKKKIVLNNICHQSIFYHKSVFGVLGGFNQKYKVCADHDFNIRAAVTFSFFYINEIIANFTGGGMSSHPDRDFIQDFDKNVVEYHLSLVRFLNINAHTLSVLSAQYFRQRKYLKAAYLYALCMKKKIDNRL